MASIREVDLSSIVLLLGDVVGTDGILELSDNSRYAFHPPAYVDNALAGWKGNQSIQIAAPFLSLAFGKHMYSPQGWVLGSSDDSDTCDLQLAKDNTSGISRRHFKIDLSPDNHRPRLTVLSRNPVRMHIDARTVTLDQGQSLEIVSAVIIDLGEVTMRAWRPVLTRKQEQVYRRNAEKFSREFLDALPRLPLNIHTTNASTLNLRFGRGNTVYKLEESMGMVSAGSTASVMKVMELRSQRIFAAKVPHFKMSDAASKARKRWELSTEEFKKVVKLQHPNIVRAFEVLTGGHGHEPPWLIMEWVEDDLCSVNLEDRDVPRLLTHVARGLAFMHSNGFTHRDLKPENILVQRDQHRLTTAKIADFGTTKYDISGKMQTYAGSSVYMAPEFWEQELAYTSTNHWHSQMSRQNIRPFHGADTGVLSI